MNKVIKDSKFNLNRLKEESILGIIRGAVINDVSNLLDACFAGGLRFVEFTINSEESLPCIEMASKNNLDDLCIGAGTVISVNDATRAINAGAKFIVSPTLNNAVASYCKKNEVAYFPGALTPTEIEKSWNAGAAMVKIFPASQMGPDYLRTIRGPFDNILLLAVGGIKAINVGKYLEAGASAIGIGGSVFIASRMQNKEFDAIKKDISEFVLAIKSYYSRISNPSS